MLLEAFISVWPFLIQSSLGIECYTCGLEEIDPEIHKIGSYSVRVEMGKDLGHKMYNHSCYEMETKTGQNVPIKLTTIDLEDQMASVEDLQEVVNFLKAANSEWDLEKGLVIYENEYAVMRERVRTSSKPEIPDWSTWELLRLKNYDMRMWIQECGAEIQHCYEAWGDFKEQLPNFRGCSGTSYVYDNQCFKETQAVTVSDLPPQSVDVVVNLCYCGQDLCNLNINSGELPTVSALLIGLVILGMN